MCFKERKRGVEVAYVELKEGELPCTKCSGFGQCSILFGLFKVVKCFAADPRARTGIEIPYEKAKDCPGVQAPSEEFFTYHGTMVPPPDS